MDDGNLRCIWKEWKNAKAMKIRTEIRRLTLIALGLAFLCPSVWAGQPVVYAMTDESIRVMATNRASGPKHGPLIPEYKTEIFAIDPDTGGKELIFSDASMPLMLASGNTACGSSSILAGGGRIFAMAFDRQDAANLGASQAASAMYELSTDGSGRVRKLFDLDWPSCYFASPSGSKIAYYANSHRLVRDTTTGKLLLEAEDFSGVKEVWKDFTPEMVRGVWTADDRILFTLWGDLSNEDDDDQVRWSTPNSPVGTYVMNLDGSNLHRLAPEAALHPKVLDMKPLNDQPAEFVGILPNGQYLFYDSEYSPTGSRNAVYVYSLDLASGTQKIFPSPTECGWTDLLYLSRSGGKLATVASSQGCEQRQMGAVRGLPVPTPSAELWVVDLRSDKRMKVFSLSYNDVPKGTRMNLIGWLEE